MMTSGLLLYMLIAGLPNVVYDLFFSCVFSAYVRL